MPSEIVRKGLLISAAAFAVLTLIGASFVGNKVVAAGKPPVGKLIYKDPDLRVYLVDGTDPATWQHLKTWAAKWGARIPGKSYGGFGGDLAQVIITVPGGRLVTSVDHAITAPKNHLLVTVKEQPLTLSNVWLRIKTLL